MRMMVGAMSGTSADGVDVAVVQVEGRGLDMSATLLGHHQDPFDPDLRGTIVRIREKRACSLTELASLARTISLAYAGASKIALQKSSLAAEQVSAIAAHGQTLFHAPPSTIQWFDPALLAAQTECAVVSDFRRADCAAGGQGAPLVPFGDYLLFRHPERTRVLLNLGGIANVTYLPAGGGLEKVVAFDTGPANCISDYLCRRHGIPVGYDTGGKLAATGSVHNGVVDAYMRADYFLKQPPKSTDGPAMVRLFDSAVAASGKSLSLPDLLATSAAVTARTIVEAIEHCCDPRPADLIASGGGTENRTVMDLLRQYAERIGIHNVSSSEHFGVPSAAKEAIAFALLGAATLDGFPSNVPSATGASRAVILGSITPKP